MVTWATSVKVAGIPLGRSEIRALVGCLAEEAPAEAELRSRFRRFVAPAVERLSRALQPATEGGAPGGTPSVMREEQSDGNGSSSPEYLLIAH